ncbi:ribosomal protein S18-alanine N-acetyltransferase [Demequina activiva]|uniref:Ribosomal-protein-alanine acetyltransferase n=1 Tax=Demequina activiva TaxID=1582364 RepID=A0A919Q5B3_9MICO|nr:ribosomal protein S18-alanine N-acetyltransferase [Demequina activiva]GIG54788.1 ribosomal-protein-alanine acetyltransferase [Demequina activiva]
MTESASAVPEAPVIRDLEEAELPWVVQQEREIFGAAAWSPELVREDFLMGASRWRGVELEGELEGYAVYGFDGDAFSLMNVAIRADARGRGLGHAVLTDFLEEARRLEAPEAWLEVAVTNSAALALYRSHGFEDVRVRRKYYQPEGVDALVMRRRLR